MAQATRKNRQVGNTAISTDIPNSEVFGSDEPSIDEMLGPEPEPKAKKERKIAEPRESQPDNAVLVSFTQTSTGKKIIAPGVKYYVVRDANKKLHYKEASAVTILPDGWKEGDPIPGEDELL